MGMMIGHAREKIDCTSLKLKVVQNVQVLFPIYLKVLGLIKLKIGCFKFAKYIDVWDLQRSKVFLGQSSLSFIDDCTRVPRVYLMKQKLDVSTIFSVFYKMMSV